MVAQLLFMASIPGKPGREDHTVLTIEEAFAAFTRPSNTQQVLEDFDIRPLFYFSGEWLSNSLTEL